MNEPLEIYLNSFRYQQSTLAHAKIYEKLIIFLNVNGLLKDNVI